jgi:GAF domain-containing protein
LRADGVGLMLADRQGTLRWVTATNRAEQAFEQAERDLGEGPCIDAYTGGQVISTADLRFDPRWPRLGPAARTNQIRGVLSAPVLLDGEPIGTCNALTNQARGWTEAHAGAVRAFELLRRRARSSERKLADVARELIARRP